MTEPQDDEELRGNHRRQRGRVQIDLEASKGAIGSRTFWKD